MKAMYEEVRIALELNNTTGFQKISSGYVSSGLDECIDSYNTFSREWWYCVFWYHAQTVSEFYYVI